MNPPPPIAFHFRRDYSRGMTDDLDDLLGDPETPAAPLPKRRGRPPKDRSNEAAVIGGLRRAVPPQETSSTERSLAEHLNARIEKKVDTTVFLRPVTISFLAEVFRMNPVTVKKRLAALNPVGMGGARRPVEVYDFVEAAAYLVKPKIDLVTLLSSLNSNNIPPHINKTFWDAMNAKAKWEANARHTWRDEDVLAVLGTAAIKIREVSLLWVDQLPDKVSLSGENIKALRQAVADLLEQIKTELADMPKERKTLSVISTQEQMLEGDMNVALDDVLVGDYSDEDMQ